MNKINKNANRYIYIYLFLSFLLFTLLGAFLYYYLVPMFITLGIGSLLFHQLIIAISLLCLFFGIYSVIRLTVLLFFRQIDIVEE
jgi:hypothetical protein